MTEVDRTSEIPSRGWFSRNSLLLLGLGLSFVVHVVLLNIMQFVPQPPPKKPAIVELEVRQPPPPPPPPPPKEEPKPEPKPQPKKPPLVRPKVVKTLVPPPRTPANPPPDAEPPKPVAGLSADSFAPGAGPGAPTFGAGNTVMAEPPRQAPKVQDVKPYAPVDLTAISSEPRLISRPTPTEVFGAEYPPDAKAQGIQGVTRVKLLIDEGGIVREVKAVKGPPLLRGPAEALAKRFRYKPATQNGTPVAVWWYEEIPFRIND